AVEEERLRPTGPLISRLRHDVLRNLNLAHALPDLHELSRTRRGVALQLPPLPQGCRSLGCCCCGPADCNRQGEASVDARAAQIPVRPGEATVRSEAVGAAKLAVEEFTAAMRRLGK